MKNTLNLQQSTVCIKDPEKEKHKKNINQVLTVRYEITRSEKKNGEKNKRKINSQGLNEHLTFNIQIGNQGKRWKEHWAEPGDVCKIRF